MADDGEVDDVMDQSWGNLPDWKKEPARAMMRQLFPSEPENRYEELWTADAFLYLALENKGFEVSKAVKEYKREQKRQSSYFQHENMLKNEAKDGKKVAGAAGMLLRPNDASALVKREREDSGSEASGSGSGPRAPRRRRAEDSRSGASPSPPRWEEPRAALPAPPAPQEEERYGADEEPPAATGPAGDEPEPRQPQEGPAAAASAAAAVGPPHANEDIHAHMFRMVMDLAAGRATDPSALQHGEQALARYRRRGRVDERRVKEAEAARKEAERRLERMAGRRRRAVEAYESRGEDKAGLRELAEQNEGLRNELAAARMEAQSLREELDAARAREQNALRRAEAAEGRDEKGPLRTLVAEKDRLLDELEKRRADLEAEARRRREVEEATRAVRLEVQQLRVELPAARHARAAADEAAARLEAEAAGLRAAEAAASREAAALREALAQAHAAAEAELAGVQSEAAELRARLRAAEDEAALLRRAGTARTGEPPRLPDGDSFPSVYAHPAIRLDDLTPLP